jgi:ElaB/YqjD/DUF883 family membrane-anchored ribosome-binding protein
MEAIDQATDRLSDTINGAKEGLDKDIHQTAEHVQDFAQKVKDYGQNSDNPTVSKYAKEVGETLQKSADYLESQDMDRLTQEVKEQLATKVRKHPLLSISIAVTTGFILARLLSRA